MNVLFQTMLTLSPQDISAIILSLKVAVSATAIATPFGFAAAHFLVFSKIRGKIPGARNLVNRGGV